MKKTILAIISLTIITFTGCYDPDSATVRINLGNIPIANNTQIHFIDRIFRLFEKDAFAVPETVQKVHIAAYSGGSLVASLSLDAAEVGSNNDVAELEVPAGENITFLVIGQGIRYVNDSPVNYARYFGLTTTNIKAGETKEISASVNSNDYWSEAMEFTFNYDNNVISWTNLGIPVKYKVTRSPSDTVLYEDSNNSYIENNLVCEESIYLTIVFDNFNIETDGSIYNSLSGLCK